jgi:hypothetical protein
MRLVVEGWKKREGQGKRVACGRGKRKFPGETTREGLRVSLMGVG